MIQLIFNDTIKYLMTFVEMPLVHSASTRKDYKTLDKGTLYDLPDIYVGQNSLTNSDLNTTT